MWSLRGRLSQLLGAVKVTKLGTRTQKMGLSLWYTTERERLQEHNWRRAQRSFSSRTKSRRALHVFQSLLQDENQCVKEPDAFGRRRALCWLLCLATLDLIKMRDFTQPRDNNFPNLSFHLSAAALFMA